MSRASRERRRQARKGKAQQTVNPELVGKTDVLVIRPRIREIIEKAAKAVDARKLSRAEEKRLRRARKKIVAIANASLKEQS